MMHPLAASLERSPELFPLTLAPNSDIVNLVRLSEADFARASFLDDRALGRQTVGRRVALSELETAVADTGLEEQCGFILHIGHVGSTLMSRLLGSHPAMFALREPAVLRTLAQRYAQQDSRTWNQVDFNRRLTCFLKLLSRTFQPGQQANIKATSFVSELAAELLARPSAPKTILLFVSPETYLATILGGPNSRQEARMLAESRLRRLHRRIGETRWQLSDLSEGETIAMSWACEMSALVAASEAAGDRVLWVNFDRFLDEPKAALVAAFKHFGISAADSEVDAILSGPEMRRYSKAPEHAYDTKLRGDVLDQARREHADEIARGIAWIERLSAATPAIRDALTRN